MMKIFAAALSALLIVPAAKAQEEPSLYKEFGNWGVYRYSDYCRAIAQYETSTMTIAYDSRKDLAVIHMRSRELARFTDEQVYPFAIVLLQNGKSDYSLGNVDFTVINKPDFVGAMASLKASTLFDALARSTALALAYQDQKIEAVALGDVAPVLESLQRCDQNR